VIQQKLTNIRRHRKSFLGSKLERCLRPQGQSVCLPAFDLLIYDSDSWLTFDSRRGQSFSGL